MKKVITRIIRFSINDVRNIFRDPSLVLLFIIPFLFLFILRYGIPLIEKELPEVQGYYSLIVAVFCAITVVFPAFIISFIMLDEREENLIMVYKVLPISPSIFILYRISFMLVFGILFSFTILYFSGLAEISIIQAILISVEFSLMAPVTALTILSFAQNKIAGMTFFKLMMIVLVVPAIGMIMYSPWKVLMGVIPMYWTYQSLAVVDHPGIFTLNYTVSILYHGVILWVLYLKFRKLSY